MEAGVSAQALLLSRARRDARCPRGRQRELTLNKGAAASRERRPLLLAAFRVHLLLDALLPAEVEGQSPRRRTFASTN